MPGTNGIDFVASLLAKDCRPPRVAVMSGAWSDEGFARAKALGCTLFTKPFQVSEIVAWLKSVEREVTPERRLFDWHGLMQVDASLEPEWRSSTPDDELPPR